MRQPWFFNTKYPVAILQHKLVTSLCRTYAFDRLCIKRRIILWQIMGKVPTIDIRYSKLAKLAIA